MTSKARVKVSGDGNVSVNNVGANASRRFRAGLFKALAVASELNLSRVLRYASSRW